MRPIGYVHDWVRLCFSLTTVCQMCLVRLCTRRIPIVTAGAELAVYASVSDAQLARAVQAMAEDKVGE